MEKLDNCFEKFKHKISVIKESDLQKIKEHLNNIKNENLRLENEIKRLNFIVENFIKEKANGKSTSEASSQIRQGNSERKGLVGKAKEDKEQQKIISLEDTSDEVSSSYGLKREDR